MSKNTILNIGSGYYQSSIIKEAKRLGYKVISCDINPDAPGLKYANKKIIVDCHNHLKVYDKIKKYKKDIVAVISGATRDAIYTTAYIANKLNLNGLNINAAKMVIDKNLISKKFNKGIFINYSQLNIINKNKKIKKIVVKLNKVSGQNGIKIFNNSIKNKRKIIEYCAKFNQEDLSLEKLVKGKHFVITGLSLNKKQIIYGIIYKTINKDLKTISLVTKNKYIEDNKLAIISYVKKVLDKIKLECSPFQIELFLDDNNKFYLGEIEPAIPGSYISSKLIPCSTGENFIRDCIKFIINLKLKKIKINKIKKVKLIFKNNTIYKKLKNYNSYKYGQMRIF